MSVGCIEAAAWQTVNASCGDCAESVASRTDAELASESQQLLVHTFTPLPWDRGGYRSLVARAAVDPALVEKEKEIIAATPEVQAKPEAMRPKIVEGKLGRFFKESVLLEQEMLFDAEKGESVEKYGKRVGIAVAAFGRLQVGH